MSRLVLLAALVLSACQSRGSAETITLVDVDDQCGLTVRDASGAERQLTSAPDACSTARLLVGASVALEVVDENGTVTEIGPAPGVAGGAETP